MTRWRFPAVAIICVLGGVGAARCSDAGRACDGQASTTVLLVRHAEKSAEPAEDPRLSPVGETRAAELVRVAGEAGIDAIYVTATTRTRRTAEDLAAHLGLTPIELAPADTDGLARRILDRHRGQTVLAVGHSNTVPAVIEALGGPSLPDIDEADYDDLFVVTVPCAGKVTQVQLAFGVASPRSGPP
ncbi:MAG TPA: histidine phosphatase family protein [Candidatus Polarisedimenticolaceae bacterium]|nr:histidine phosphatase family protein [Candidatus Polarisedimenticolaceae bacterium]